MNGKISDISMPDPVEMADAFCRYGADMPSAPVVVSVPHAGRSYDAETLSRAAVPLETLYRLEDRFADLLAHDLIAMGHAVIIARQPRALIDLNRHEWEFDPDMIARLPREAVVRGSAKVRAGLGLVPRRLGGRTPLWRSALPWSELQERIARLHRPYHEALGQMLKRAKSQFGSALLIDLHSMPPLLPSFAGGKPAEAVVGDLFGRSASTRISALAADMLRSRGLEVAHNHPYSGGHLLERHGRPDSGVHAIQIELSRALYLDAALLQPGEGVQKMRKVVTELVGLMAEELAPRWDIAAE